MIRLVFPRLDRVKGVGGLVGIESHKYVYMALGTVLVGKLYFLDNLGRINFACTRGWDVGFV